MDRDFVDKQFGEVIDFGLCAVGTNLNVITLRGYARLDQLAAVSAPDVFDQVENPEGTQRNLNKKHADECLTYAEGAVDLPPEDEPRIFPEILLNARDANPVEIYAPENPEELVELSSTDDFDEIGQRVLGVRVRIGSIDFPKPTGDPQISRVDGNHRLAATDDLLEGAAASGDQEALERAFPTVPFSLLVDLGSTQEASLFRDINGEHKGMETAHLDQLRIRRSGEALKADSKTLPLWLANELAGSGRAFDGMVFFGGAQEGVRREFGQVPPVRINALKTNVGLLLKDAPLVAKSFESEPEALLALLDNYWSAIAAKFPDAWNNKRDYILLQAIGLGAFSRFGARVVERLFESGNINKSDFEVELEPVSKIDLSRSNFPGIAGAGGIQAIFDLLLDSDDQDKSKAERVKKKLLGNQPSPLEKLDSSTAAESVEPS